MAIIGIDLGTSNSAAAVLRGGRPVIIPSSEGVSLGGKAFPSYVAITHDGQKLVGEPARRQATANPDGTATGFKRLMGQRKKIKLHDKEFTPEQLSAFLLQKIKNDAVSFLGEPIEKAVVTVPAYFDDNQRSATKDACKIAGIEVARLINEPTAASLAYGLDRLAEELRIAVIDFGGGTLDITIMEFGKGVFEVKSTSGDTKLGGSDMDEDIFEYLADKFHKESGIDIHKDPKAVSRLREAAEIAKIDLSTSTTTRISLPYLAARKGEVYNFDMEMSRAQLERLALPIVERCRGPVEQALRDAQIQTKDIDRIIFVGGPTRMPVVRNFFEKILERTAEMGVDPMECVASGAAIQAGVLSGEVGDIVLVDVTPLTLGVETLGGVATPLIKRNTPIPIRHTESFTTAADMQTSVTVNVFQGERPMAGDNTSLGLFNLDGIPPAPRGVPKIEITFDIDSNGILNATAKDTATSKSQSIRITGSTRLSDEDKERMINEAEKFAKKDKQRKEEAEKLNTADATCYQAEKMLADFSEKLPDELRKSIEDAMHKTKDAISKHDAQLASEQAKDLENVLKEAGTTIYAQTSKTEDSGQTETSSTSEEKDASKPSDEESHSRVVDAEYEET